MVEVILVQLPDRRVEESLAYTALSGSSHREEPVHPPRALALEGSGGLRVRV